VKRVAFALLALTLACRPQQPAAPQTGASSGRAAVDGIMGALRAGDIQAVSKLWGTARGPSRDDDRFQRDELERRIVLMSRCFTHDSYRIVGRVAGKNGGEGYAVELRRRNQIRRTTLNAVRARSKRWYVDELDVDPVREFCQQPAR